MLSVCIAVNYCLELYLSKTYIFLYCLRNSSRPPKRNQTLIWGASLAHFPSLVRMYYGSGTVAGNRLDSGQPAVRISLAKPRSVPDSWTGGCE